MGGTPVDFTPPLNHDINGRSPSDSENKVVVSYLDSYQKVDNLFWTIAWLGANNGDNLLDGGEMVQVTVGNVTAGLLGGNLEDALSVRHLGINTKFTIQVVTSGGATSIFERTTPAYLDRTLNFH
jgi:hypothetical protein